ncbi:hypothetical protein HFE03_07070 [Paenibacillus sp. EKM102P]|uniref:hypothetical protein n=1 Tax=unclassified Paenibacillus TaxID=185978 RepID=UPI00142D7294|nr:MULTISPECIES: hypothetical protein [unclassified Paenibacillus]KAF6620408.1 hypothetical protein HFE00_04975 [Paenibacillus sp. EKM101P]KAF6623400.1 hypothetical protein HFE03_07070 [Paenibacillus sp. EKM102P]KAF6634038.1 hypothetical protein HFE01_07440 [Paenibacillus sp. EKM10P]KAF6649564.1 hypothetical protein HFE02_02400 [Paenibacillus sp. EKM11P]
MNDIYVIGGTVLFVLIGVLVIAWFKKRGVNLSDTDSILGSVDVGNLILEVLPIAEQHKGKANFVLDVASEVIEYVHNYSNDTLTFEQKEKVVVETVDGLLNRLEVTPTDKELKLIEILVHKGIRLLDTSVAATPVKQ